MPTLVFDTSPLFCKTTVDAREYCEFAKDMKAYSLEDKYNLDTIFQSSRGGGALFDYRMRFLLESRGIDASQWSMAPGTGHYERGAKARGISPDELIQMNNSGWKITYDQILAKRDNHPRQGMTLIGADPNNGAYVNACNALAKKSLGALASPKESSLIEPMSRSHPEYARSP
jgi:hypothetical protein